MSTWKEHLAQLAVAMLERVPQPVPPALVLEPPPTNRAQRRAQARQQAATAIQQARR